MAELELKWGLREVKETMEAILNDVENNPKEGDLGFAHELLKPPADETYRSNFEDFTNDTEFRTSLHNTLPLRPFVNEVSYIIFWWGKLKDFPLKLAPMNLLNEVPERFDNINEVTPKLAACVEIWNNPILPKVMKIASLKAILNALTLRSVLLMLRLRNTVGSALAFPVEMMHLCRRSTLEFFFNQIHSGKLSHGARALAKHCHRCKDGWWGKAEGPQPQQTEQAKLVLKRILDDASWINIHALPHDVKVLEVRTKDGYGVRWTHEGEFRGFLEPPMEDGHAVGWNH